MLDLLVNFYLIMPMKSIMNIPKNTNLLRHSKNLICGKIAEYQHDEAGKSLFLRKGLQSFK
jgi:hypothetical protein